MSGYSPADFYTHFWRWFGVALFCLAVIAGLVVGGWQAGWWFTNQNVNRESHMIRNGFANQQTLREQITTQIGNVDTITVEIAQVSGNAAEIGALEAQRIAVVNIACQDASQVTGDPLPSQQAAWVAKNCLAGVIRPGSPYDRTGNQ